MTRQTTPEPDRDAWSFDAGVCLAANAVADLRVVPGRPVPDLGALLDLIATHDAGFRVKRPGPGDRGALACGDGTVAATVTPAVAPPDGDWIDGYASVLAALAGALEPAPLPRRPGAVAVVGNLHARNEGDAQGDVAELDRTCRQLGLELVSTWLSGGTVADLARVSEAEVLVALPCGAEAGRVLAARTGARLVEAPLPFGLSATQAFVTRLAAATGRESEAAAFVAGELRWAARALEWIVPRRFLARPVAFCGSPLEVEGFVDIATLVGLDVVRLVATGRERALPAAEAAVATGMPRVEWASSPAAVGPSPGAELVVGPARAVAGIDHFRAVEFGFPSQYAHFCGPAPHLGFEGFLFFADRLSNAIGDRIRAL